jgi:hypothetical protein
LAHTSAESEGEYFRFLRREKEAEKFVCEKCGFETNSQIIFMLHKKNCPRI